MVKHTHIWLAQVYRNAEGEPYTQLHPHLSLGIDVTCQEKVQKAASGRCIKYDSVLPISLEKSRKKARRVVGQLEKLA